MISFVEVLSGSRVVVQPLSRARYAVHRRESHLRTRGWALHGIPVDGEREYTSIS